MQLQSLCLLAAGRAPPGQLAMHLNNCQGLLTETARVALRDFSFYAYPDPLASAAKGGRPALLPEHISCCP